MLYRMIQTGIHCASPNSGRNISQDEIAFGPKAGQRTEELD
ncbi:hypothetical protein CES85_4619 [Ochrobactrum quorumnocens]|uniref:Uncharacterized protein n=1 Tax=Ochrobactrum quorumnocens TaxID=271865 RepID=A0A248UAZ4_9HYPH|nr:hypothetical protein CES85_4619 [[Ochrobactrum] quorumnocens]